MSLCWSSARARRATRPRFAHASRKGNWPMHDLYEIWAPPGGRWSPWVKPILFLHLEGPDEPAPGLTQMDVSWVRAAGEGSAVVIDLPGASAIACAMELA